MNDAVANVVRRGTRGVLLVQAASQLLSLGVLAYLFRVLGPEPFGRFGMLLPLLQIARMAGAWGFHTAVVQAPELPDAVKDAAFWMNQRIGVAVAAAFALAGWAWEWITGVEGLGAVAAGLVVTLLCNTLATVHQGLWERELRVVGLALRRLVAQIAGAAAAVLLAPRLASVWVLVVQQQVEWLVLVGLLWQGHPWRPQWRPVRSARELASFGSWFTGANLLLYFSHNVDKLVLGLGLGATPAGRVVLGYYTQVYQLVTKPVLLVTAPLYGVLLPALARARTTPPVALRVTRHVFSLASLFLLPSAVGLVLLAPETIGVLGGARWAGAAPLLVWMAPLIGVLGISNLCGSVLSAYGRSRSLFLASLAQTVAATAVPVGLVAWGGAVGQGPTRIALWTAAAMTLLHLVLIAPLYWNVTLRLVGLAPARVLVPLAGLAACALAMGAALWGLGRLIPGTWPPVLRLVVLVPAGALVHLVLAWPVFRVADRGGD